MLLAADMHLAHTLGMPAVSARQFYTTSELMYPHVQDMVDGQCELAKQKMKEKPAAELGSFQNAVTTANGAGSSQSKFCL